jgi:hypothetical protein
VKLGPGATDEATDEVMLERSGRTQVSNERSREVRYGDDILRKGRESYKREKSEERDSMSR